jgi:integral membrane protein (TIGR00529 family)
VTDILKISLVFIVLLLFLRLKWNVGYVLLVASGLLAVLYRMSPAVLMATIRDTVTDAVTIKLFFALTLIRVLEMVLREKEVLARMTDASKDLLKRKRAVIISMPLLIGLLPSLGGAYFSAPMVEESTRGLQMSPEEKGFINYWFRHPWEFILPLYPGILLAAALSRVELRSLILSNAPYAVLFFGTGFLFSMRGVKGGDAEDRKLLRSRSLRISGLVSFLPLILILLLVIPFHMELHYALGIAIAGLVIFYRIGAKKIFYALKHGFALEVIVLIFGTMVFKFVMDNSGAVAGLSRFFAVEGIPLLPVLFVLPFVSGLLTGLTIGFVGGTFPLLISLAGGFHLNQISFAFVSGYAGVLLSPVHLCFVLTREYFKADVWGMYKKVVPGCGIVLAAALAGYLLL